MLTVLQSVTRWQRAQSSAQYVDHLVAGPGDDLRIEFFSYVTALRRRFDVFHVHWPERVWRVSSPARSAFKAALFGVVLLKMRVSRTAVVRTVHNVTPHQDATWWERPLLRLVDRWTDVAILLNHDVPPQFSATSCVRIPHPHYGPVVDAFGEPAPTVPGRLLYFGHIHPYKNLDRLVEAFAAVSDPELTLHVVGRPADAVVAANLATGNIGDPRVHTVLEEVPDRTLVDEVARAELVVLPYRELYNSGSVLMALSVGRPVLVPDVASMAELRAEVGEEWIRTYTGELDATDITGALAASVAPGASPRRAMGHRDWDVARDRTVRAYRWAVHIRTGHYPDPGVAPSSSQPTTGRRAQQV